MFLQCCRIIKNVSKKNKIVHNSSNLLMKQLHKINSDSVTWESDQENTLYLIQTGLLYTEFSDCIQWYYQGVWREFEVPLPSYSSSQVFIFGISWYWAIVIFSESNYLTYRLFRVHINQNWHFQRIFTR